MVENLSNPSGALRKKASLTSKLLQGHVSNVKESFYLFDQTKCHSKAVRNTLINNQIETLLKSQLYGAVVLVSFRNYAREVHFESEELTQKYAPDVLVKNTVRVEMTQPGGGEERKVGNTVIKMPPKKEII